MPARSELFDESFLRKLEGLHLIAKRLAAGGPAGHRRSAGLGDGLEFADHRGYQPGDDLRFIDWPYFARMEKLLLRLFHEHSEAGVGILLDCSDSMASAGAMEKFDYARRAAAALAYVAMGSGERVEVLPFADEPAPAKRTGRNRMQIFEVLDFLAGLSPSGRTGLARCVEKLAARKEVPGTVVLIGDLLDCQAELDSSLALLASRVGDRVVLHVYSPTDADPDLTGALLLRHAETGASLPVRASESLRASYRRQWEKFVAGCQRTCAARGTLYAAAPTDVPFERLVLQTLRRAGVLAG